MNLRYMGINDMLAYLFILTDIFEGSIAVIERPGTHFANSKWLWVQHFHSSYPLKTSALSLKIFVLNFCLLDTDFAN